MVFGRFQPICFMDEWVKLEVFAVLSFCSLYLATISSSSSGVAWRGVGWCRSPQRIFQSRSRSLFDSIRFLLEELVRFLLLFVVAVVSYPTLFRFFLNDSPCLRLYALAYSTEYISISRLWIGSGGMVSDGATNNNIWSDPSQDLRMHGCCICPISKIQSFLLSRSLRCRRIRHRLAS